MKAISCQTLCWTTLACIASFMVACKATVPSLPKMEAETHVQTEYSHALEDLNLVLQVHLPPDLPTTHYYVKPVSDATGLSSTGEIPFDITALVRDAISQIHYKVRHLEQYDVVDIHQIQAENAKMQSGKLLTRGVKLGTFRPSVDYTIIGRISQFDRNLESQSDKIRGMGNFGTGLSRTDINASAEKASRISRLAVSFSVFDANGVSLPGKFGGSMEVHHAKNGLDLGFAIFGNGLGFGTEATATHGRHLALQMLTEFSAIQILGRSLYIPYWRVGSKHNIFQQDNLVVDGWRMEYASMSESQKIAFMQSQCIACGDNSVSVTGHFDQQTQEAFDRFAEDFGVQNRVYPNFDLFKALELNRKLDIRVAASAWSAYLAYKNGGSPVVPPQKPSSTPASAPHADKPKPAAAPKPAPAAVPGGDAPKPKPAATPERSRRPSGGGSAPSRDDNPFGGLL